MKLNSKFVEFKMLNNTDKQILRQGNKIQITNNTSLHQYSFADN